MSIDMSHWGPITVLVAVIVAAAAIAGAVITIIQPSTLSFEQYLNDLEKFVIGAGLLGIGRGVHLGLTNAGVAGSSVVAEVQRHE